MHGGEFRVGSGGNRLMREQVSNTHLILLSAAHHYLNLTKHPEGRYYSCMGVNLFSFLAIEAFMNAVGVEIIPPTLGVEYEQKGAKEKLLETCHSNGVCPTN